MNHNIQAMNHNIQAIIQYSLLEYFHAILKIISERFA